MIHAARMKWGLLALPHDLSVAIYRHAGPEARRRLARVSRTLMGSLAVGRLGTRFRDKVYVLSGSGSIVPEGPVGVAEA